MPLLTGEDRQLGGQGCSHQTPGPIKQPRLSHVRLPLLPCSLHWLLGPPSLTCQLLGLTLAKTLTHVKMDDADTLPVAGDPFSIREATGRPRSRHSLSYPQQIRGPGADI